MEGKNVRKLKMAEILPVIILPVILLLSFFAGKYNIDFSKIFDSGTLDYGVFWRLRAARSKMAFISGIALGVAGNTLQTVFRNPLAAPDVIGVASGASAGAAFAIVFGGSALFSVPFSALCGGLLAVGLVLLLGRLSGRGDTVTLLLAGIVINAIFQAALMIIKLCADSEQTLAGVEFWLMGSFADTTLSVLLPVLVPVIVGLVAIFFIHRPLRLLLLPDDEAAMLGVRVKLTRYLALFFATLVTAAVISENGLISFVGLIAPHIARRLVKGRNGAMIMSGIIGAELMLAADMAVRVIGTSELPVSVATSVIGAPVLFLLVCRREKQAAAVHLPKLAGSADTDRNCPQKPAATDRNCSGKKAAGQQEKRRPPETGNVSVRLEDLTAGYFGDRIIKNINLEIYSGQLCSIIGQNGSGKTTLIKAVMGLIPGAGKAELSPDIGYMAALSDAALPVNVFEMVMLGWYRELGSLKKAGEKEIKAAEAILERLGMAEYRDRDYRTLSTGQKQLVCLARTIVREPEILILDEPDSALDFDKRAFVMRLLKEYAEKGRTVIMCSHDINLMLRYADRVILLKDGCLAGDCDTKDITGIKQAAGSVYGNVEIADLDGTLMLLEGKSERG